MKKLFIVLILLFGIISCGEEVDNENKVPSIGEMLNTCKSECGTNAQNYCLGEKTFLNNGNEVTGTCRSFSKYNIGFGKCEGFCKQFGKNKIRCSNSDGSLNKSCN